MPLYGLVWQVLIPLVTETVLFGEMRLCPDDGRMLNGMCRLCLVLVRDDGVYMLLVGGLRQ